MNKKQLVLSLFDIGAVKFGDFTLKSGIQSPVYFDLRVIVSYPSVLKQLSEAIWDTVKDKPFNCLCGVPYTALPVATHLSLTYDIPMVMRRKEIKDYGTKKAIEGKIIPQSQCLVIEDLITSGSSVFETIHPLEQAGLRVRDVVVFLDREQGGKERIEQKGYHCTAVIGISELLEILEAEEKIPTKMKEMTLDFIACNQA